MSKLPFQELALKWMVLDAIAFPQGVSHNEPHGGPCCCTLDVNSLGIQGNLGAAGRERSVPSRHEADRTTMGSVHCVIQ